MVHSQDLISKHKERGIIWMLLRHIQDFLRNRKMKFVQMY